MPKQTPYDLAPRVPPESAGNLTERVLMIRRIAKVTAGGKNMRFNAMVAVGDGRNIVGIGLGKAAAVPDAVRKGVAIARRNLIEVPLRGTTIPHDIVTKYRSSQVVLKPAVDGTGVVAGATVRAVVDLAGIKDILTKAVWQHEPNQPVQGDDGCPGVTAGSADRGRASKGPPGRLSPLSSSKAVRGTQWHGCE